MSAVLPNVNWKQKTHHETSKRTFFSASVCFNKLLIINHGDFFMLADVKRRGKKAEKRSSGIFPPRMQLLTFLC